MTPRNRVSTTVTRSLGFMAAVYIGLLIAGHSAEAKQVVQHVETENSYFEADTCGSTDTVTLRLKPGANRIRVLEPILDETFEDVANPGSVVAQIQGITIKRGRNPSVTWTAIGVEAVCSGEFPDPYWKTTDLDFRVKYSRLESLPYLTKSDARYYASVALRRRFKETWEYSRKRLVCKRRARHRFRCRVSFVIGDSAYHGSMGIWLSWEGAKAIWNYSIDLVHVNEYCVAIGKPYSECHDRIRVK